MKFRKPFWLIYVTLVGAVVLAACTLGSTPAPPTEDPGAVQTQAFGIVLTQAALQLTQTAMANPPALPTDTPMPMATPTAGFPTFAPIGGSGTTPQPTIPGTTAIPTNVPTLGIVSTITTKNGCNDGYYVDETKPLDGTKMKPNTDFEKGWTIKNTGTCAWDVGYAFMPNSQWSTGIDALKGLSTNIVLKKATDAIKPGASQLFLLKLKTPMAIGKYKWCWKLQDKTGNVFGPLVCTIFEVAQ